MTPAMKRGLQAATVDGLSRIRAGWVARGRGGAISQDAEVHRPGTVDALIERGMLSRYLGDDRVQLTQRGRDALATINEMQKRKETTA